VAFVEDGLVRLVFEGVFDVLKFSEVVPFEVAQYRLPAKRAGIATLGETGLSFHDLPFIQVFRMKAEGDKLSRIKTFSLKAFSLST
jgi:hypothetical protein